ncbi:FkbM family methyltransferase [Methanofollis aquaemaris]|uniref:FkbM family methyltransferase n=1 Tax=Methanofollis aquaemaris TaxID=126734 RepID=A0A8A3S8M4_9EURY|nr:FkbM family methyltransferase [Methanofollis aquaemaris]QSZ68030.1 FkbM family methyltransferase [Methanofollis aquaemaris]
MRRTLDEVWERKRAENGKGNRLARAAVEKINGLFLWAGTPLELGFRERHPEVFKESVGVLAGAVGDPAKYDRVRALLSDERSKEIFDWLVGYRVAYALIGNGALELRPPPIARDEFWRLQRETERYRSGHYYRYDGSTVHSDAYVFNTIWLQEQYRVEGLCEPRPGDIVVDAGACWGETAVWFSRFVGPSGRVHAFEPAGANRRVIERVVEKNDLTSSVVTVPLGLWDQETTLTFSGTGRMFRQGGGVGGAEVPVTTLDRYVEETGLDRVDFIKMDIEGAELPALAGAEKSIREFRPDLAISVYHRADDLTEVPIFLASLVPEYRMYLRHYTPGPDESVLYATVR